MLKVWHNFLYAIGLKYNPSSATAKIRIPCVPSMLNSNPSRAIGCCLTASQSSKCQYCPLAFFSLANRHTLGVTVIGACEERRRGHEARRGGLLNNEKAVCGNAPWALEGPPNARVVGDGVHYQRTTLRP